jgi:hypothetical protein
MFVVTPGLEIQKIVESHTNDDHDEAAHISYSRAHIIMAFGML